MPTAHVCNVYICVCKVAQSIRMAYIEHTATMKIAQQQKWSKQTKKHLHSLIPTVYKKNEHTMQCHSFAMEAVSVLYIKYKALDSVENGLGEEKRK